MKAERTKCRIKQELKIESKERERQKDVWEQKGRLRYWCHVENWDIPFI